MKNPLYALEILLLVLFVLAVYGQTHDFPFVGYDDPMVIEDNESIRDISSLDGLWQVVKPESRYGLHEWMPLKNLSLALDYALFGNTAKAYRPQALLWYILCLIAFHRFFANFLGVLAGRGLLDWDMRTRRMAALFAALLFAAHPVHVQSVAWLSSRKDLLVMTFFFAGLSWHVGSFETAGNRRTHRRIAAMLLYVLALLSKPSGLGFPLMIMLLDAILDRTENIAVFVKKHFLNYGLYFLITLAFTLIYLRVAGGDDMGLENVEEGVVFFNGTLLQLIGQQFSAYLIWTIWPMKLMHYPLFELSETYLSLKVLLGLALGLLLLAVCLTTFRKWPLAALSAGIFIAGLFPVIGQAPFRQYYEVRYLLFSVAAPSLLLAWIFVVLRRTGMRLLAFSIIAVSLLFWTALTLRDSQAWSSHELLWRDALSKEPRLWMAHKNLAVYYIEEDKAQQAAAHADGCLAINPTAENCICIKALTLYHAGKIEDALTLLENSMQHNRRGKIAANIAMIYLRQGDKRKAIDFYTKNIEGRRVYDTDLAHYASFMQEAGELGKALHLYLEAQKIRESGSYDYAKEIEKVRELIQAAEVEKQQNQAVDETETPPENN